MLRGAMDLLTKRLNVDSGGAELGNLFENELSGLLKNSETEADSIKTQFYIKNLRLHSKDLSRLSSALTTKYLQSLVLVDAYILPTLLTELCRGLKANKFIQIVDLSENPIGDQGVISLVGALKFKAQLRELYLRDVKFTADGCESLKELLKMNKKINVLDLSKNQLGDLGVEKICSGLLESPVGDATELMKLILVDCEVGDSAAKLLGSVMSKSLSIVELDLGKNRITPNGVTDLFRGLVKKDFSSLPESGDIPGVKVLSLSENKLGLKGTQAIAKYLPAVGTITQLFLKSIDMDNEGFQILSNAIIETKSVINLSVAGNPLQRKHADATDSSLYFSVITPLIHLLSNNIDMIEVDLSKVELNVDDVKLLGDFLGENVHCRVESLKLSECNIEDAGAAVLANGLKFNLGLKKLNVTGNPFGPKGALSFAKAFRRGKALKEFYVTGQSRIGAEGENYLAWCLKYNKNIIIKGSTIELDYLDEFVHHGKAFEYNEKGEMIGWSREAWNVVKRGCGQVIGTVLNNMKADEFRTFKNNVLLKSKNVVDQNMFEYILRHAEAPADEVVLLFLNKCKISFDADCSSKASVAMAKEKRASDDVTYRSVAKDCAKDPVVKELAKNKQLFFGRYLIENGPAMHETHEVRRSIAKDVSAKEDVYVQEYENDEDFIREKEAREDMKSLLAAAGPFAIYDTVLKEKEIHDETNVISFSSSLSDLRNSIANLGVTAGFNINEMVLVAKQAAQCLGTVNNLGRIHGDFKPRNFLKVAKPRLGDNPLGTSSKKVELPEKWVLFDFSKSVAHNQPVSLRSDSSYLPPEVAKVAFNKSFQEKALPLANEKMDVWAFGVVLYQLLTGIHLFHVESNTDRMFKESERLELMNWINLDEERQRLVLHRANEAQFLNKTMFKKIKESALDLLNWCLQGDPLNRPNFNAILSHPFFEYKTNINYTDVDLLFHWYNSIGSTKKDAAFKNDRTHAHVINTSSAECADVVKVLQLYFQQAGCILTHDAYDWKKDIQQRKETVQKARCLIILLTKGCLLNSKIMQKLLWAVDSNETTSVILLDISTANTKAEKFVVDDCLKELDDVKQVEELASLLCPIQEHLDIKHINLNEKSLEEDGGQSWLVKYIQTDVKNLLINLQDKIIPYRARPFQTQAMVDEILLRAGFFPKSHLQSFSLHMNNKEMAAPPNKSKESQKRLTVLVLFNEDSNDNRILNDAQSLRNKLYNLETSEYKAGVHLISKPNEIYRHFKTDDASTKLSAKHVTLVLCMVTSGFYEKFRDIFLKLNKAEGPISIIPLSYGDYDVQNKQAQSEVLNLGLENAQVLKRLKDSNSYIPLPTLKKNLEYETHAAMGYIVREAGKAMEIVNKNVNVDGSDVFVRYEQTNLFNQKVY